MGAYINKQDHGIIINHFKNNTDIASDGKRPLSNQYAC